MIMDYQCLVTNFFSNNFSYKNFVKLVYGWFSKKIRKLFIDFA